MLFQPASLASCTAASSRLVSLHLRGDGLEVANSMCSAGPETKRRTKTAVIRHALRVKVGVRACSSEPLRLIPIIRQ